MGAVAADHFERLYRADPDPWRVASAWYERRKRGLLLAALGREHYRHAFEPGCGTGELTRCLALRCAQVCAVDVAPAAAARCGERRRDQRHFHLTENAPVEAGRRQVLAEAREMPAEIALDEFGETA